MIIADEKMFTKCIHKNAQQTLNKHLNDISVGLWYIVCVGALCAYHRSHDIFSQCAMAEVAVLEKSNGPR